MSYHMNKSVLPHKPKCSPVLPGSLQSGAHYQYFITPYAFDDKYNKTKGTTSGGRVGDSLIAVIKDWLLTDSSPSSSLQNALKDDSLQIVGWVKKMILGFKLWAPGCRDWAGGSPPPPVPGTVSRRTP